MKRKFIAVVGIVVFLGLLSFKIESEVVGVQKAEEIEVSNEDTKTERVEVLNQNEHARLYDKYKSEYQAIDGKVFYVLIGEKFGEWESSEAIRMGLRRSYLQFKGGGVFTVDTTIGYESVSDIEEMRRKGIKYSKTSTGDEQEGMMMLPNTIVSEEVLKQWKEEGYDGEGSYWEMAPKGLTYDELKLPEGLNSLYAKYKNMYQGINGITFCVLLEETFGATDSVVNGMECFQRKYIVFEDGQTYPLYEIKANDNVYSIHDVRERVLSEEFDYEKGGKLSLDANTIVSQEVLDQWREEGYDGEGSYWKKAPKGFSYKDLVQRRDRIMDELQVENGERFFKIEVVPKSECEEVILKSLRIEISDEYHEFKEFYLEDRGYEHYEKAYKERFDDGMYTEELTVHNMRTLREEEYTGDPKDIRYYPYMERLEKYDYSEFKIIEVEFTNKLTEKYDRVAQWGSGYWTKYYVMVKKDEESGYGIFEVYGHI